MPLLLGTREAVYRVDDATAGTVDRVLDAGGKVYDLARVDGAWFAATTTGLHRATDLDDWTTLDLPRDRSFVTAVAGSPDGGRLFAGTKPAELYCSDDGGVTWDEPEGFRRLASRDRWWNPDVTPHVRSFATHPDAPDRLVLGIDGGGVHVSDDRGETFEERRGNVASFVHDVVALGPDEYVAATDAGVYWTLDGGRWWDYLYDDVMRHRYFRGVFADGRTVYSGGARSHPGDWDGDRGADAALYRFRLDAPPAGEPAERGVAVDAVAYPGEPREVVLSGANLDGRLVAGTNDGRLLRRADDGWTTASVLDSGSQVRCLLVR